MRGAIRRLTSGPVSGFKCKMGSPLHEWERPDRAWDRAPPPELDEDRRWDDSDSDDDLNKLSEDACQERFADMLCDVYMKGKLSAKSTCLLAYWGGEEWPKGPCD